MADDVRRVFNNVMYYGAPPVVGVTGCVAIVTICMAGRDGGMPVDFWQDPLHAAEVAGVIIALIVFYLHAVAISHLASSQAVQQKQFKVKFWVKKYFTSLLLLTVLLAIIVIKWKTEMNVGLFESSPVFDQPAQSYSVLIFTDVLLRYFTFKGCNRKVLAVEISDAWTTLYFLILCISNQMLTVFSISFIVSTIFNVLISFLEMCWCFNLPQHISRLVKVFMWCLSWLRAWEAVFLAVCMLKQLRGSWIVLALLGRAVNVAVFWNCRWSKLSSLP